LLRRGSKGRRDLAASKWPMCRPQLDQGHEGRRQRKPVSQVSMSPRRKHEDSSRRSLGPSEWTPETGADTMITSIGRAVVPSRNAPSDFSAASSAAVFVGPARKHRLLYQPSQLQDWPDPVESSPLSELVRQVCFEVPASGISLLDTERLG
jgi:hypothetical protein